MPLNSMYWLAPDFSIRSIDLSAQNKTLGPHKSTLNFLECSSPRTSGAKEEISTSEKRGRAVRAARVKSWPSVGAEGGEVGGGAEWEMRKEERSWREREV